MRIHSIKTGILCCIALLSIAGSACTKDRDEYPERKITSISGSYSNTTNPKITRWRDPVYNKTVQFTFEYDEQGRVTTLVYTGELYHYGEGLSPNQYTYTVDYSGNVPVVRFQSGAGNEAETMPLEFDDQGNIISIAGRELWIHTDITTLEYTGGRLVSIREGEEYYRLAAGLEWTNGKLTAQTTENLRRNGQVLYSARRGFEHSPTANDYSIDLNWLIADPGVNRQNGLAMLGLLGLLGDRSPCLIGSTTENDGINWPVTFSSSNGTITEIGTNVGGSIWNYRIGYE